MMLNTKYQGSRHSAFRQEFFYVFPIQAKIRHVVSKMSYETIVDDGKHMTDIQQSQ